AFLSSRKAPLFTILVAATTSGFTTSASVSSSATTFTNARFTFVTSSFSVRVQSDGVCEVMMMLLSFISTSLTAGLCRGWYGS
ncbi:hypothetical protein J3R30DRAFT_3529137, partial [Lentinula aciculospora]